MSNFMNDNRRRSKTYSQHILNTQIPNNNHIFYQQNIMSSHAQVVPGYYITPPQDEFNNSFDAPESSQEALYPSSPYTGFEPVQSLESVQSLFIPSIPMTLSVEGFSVI
ncbi:Protein of unknown function [Pyronema omphalodes CBS 100304]|uniref:Uncharacterized protein n=1 Tax=Pyronema omphalodes (strain CBS 100304) TaxID=1076935 RepID=U4L093_PYROM|nr:Protein of unknown function [Pyronema omphalodes CBS 100304]